MKSDSPASVSGLPLSRESSPKYSPISAADVKRQSSEEPLVVEPVAEPLVKSRSLYESMRGFYSYVYGLCFSATLCVFIAIVIYSGMVEESRRNQTQ